jgi:DNA repair ATPase RecN
MLTSLSIKICFNRKTVDGFFRWVFTHNSETGAGKSILLGALGLVLGKRADLLRLKTKKRNASRKLISIFNYNLESFSRSNDWITMCILYYAAVLPSKNASFLKRRHVLSICKELQELESF